VKHLPFSNQNNATGLKSKLNYK